jgi:hypothetical protein
MSSIYKAICYKLVYKSLFLNYFFIYSYILFNELNDYKIMTKTLIYKQIALQIEDMPSH